MLGVGGMVQRCPAIGIHDVELSLASKDLLKRLFLRILVHSREDYFVYGRLSDD
jgi:hypothetical protein